MGNLEPILVVGLGPVHWEYDLLVLTTLNDLTPQIIVLLFFLKKKKCSGDIPNSTRCYC